MAVVAPQADSPHTGHTRIAVHIHGALSADAARGITERRDPRTLEVIHAGDHALMGQWVTAQAARAFVGAIAIAAAVERAAGEVRTALLGGTAGPITGGSAAFPAFAADGKATAQRKIGATPHSTGKCAPSAPSCHERRRSACTTRLHIRFIRQEIERSVAAPASACQKQQVNGRQEAGGPSGCALHGLPF